MWQSLTHPWQICLEQAWEAYCAGSVPIGACITGPDGQVLSCGRNRLLDDLPSAQKHICMTPLAHAEVNTLLAFDHSACDAHLCTLYSAVEPCPLCMGALTMANIRTLCFAAADTWAGASAIAAENRYVRSKNIHVIGPQRADLQSVIIAIQVESHLHRAGQTARRVVDVWEADNPAGVRMGFRLFETGTLQDMRVSGMQANAVIDTLARMLA
jgi:tRNA(adenine34) deaminase